VRVTNNVYLRRRGLFDKAGRPDRQTSPAHPIPLDDNDAVSDIVLIEVSENFVQSSDHVRFAPIAATK
jgi:hypothetical protein